MKRTLILITIIAACAATLAARQVVTRRVSVSACNHAVYPYPDAKELPTLTPSPAGYEPFFMDHYGRHGSRWLSSQNDYEYPVKALQKADQAGQLNELGQSVLRDLQRIALAAYQHAGDLSDIGAEQHRGIAKRMYRNFPDVFAGDAAIDARSTVVLRCILSMQNETMVLRALNPRLNITTDASYHDMHYMGYGHGEDTAAFHLRKDMDKIVDAMAKKTLNPSRFAAQLFNDTTWARTNLDLTMLMRKTYAVAGIIRGHHQFDDLTLHYLFSADELFELWRLKSVLWYLYSANAPANGNRMPFIERALLRDIIEKADTAIATGNRGAAMRFGHESVVLPLACLMELDSANYSTTDLDNLHLHWRTYELIPMACNIQLILYRPIGATKCDPDDILVKVLFNEHEATLPVAAAQGPYYRWSDLRAFYDKKLATPIDWR